MLKITQIGEATVKITVEKTGKTYRRTMRYGKHIIRGPVGGLKGNEYYLRSGRGWRTVNKEEYEAATSEEAVKKLHEQLTQELKDRVEREMFVPKLHLVE